MTIPDFVPPEILRHGAYILFDAHPQLSSAPVPALVDRLALQNEFHTTQPGSTVAFLHSRMWGGPPGLRGTSTSRSSTQAMIHVSSETSAPVDEFCDEISRALTPVAIHRGVLRPPTFTGAAMHEFAYAHQVPQQPGDLMPNAFFIPLSKAPDWWAKSWMERHTYFLPRYDDSGRMLHEGHALAAAAGIPCLYRRTYRYAITPAPEGYYDFLNYFECSDDDVPTFHAVCAALRDVRKNPEWKFVNEGPTWSGRRVREWSELFQSYE